MYPHESKSGFSADQYCQALLESALLLAGLGIAVFPLKYRTKEPATRHGFYNATTNSATIRRWFGGDFKYNLGARTGQASGILVLDIDEPGSLEALEAQHGPLPLTRQSRSSRGLHFWFKAPIIPLQSSKSRIGLGLDVQSDGNYVCTPPSVHPDGWVYRWLNDEPIVEAPSWFLVLARKSPPLEPPPPRQFAPQVNSGRHSAYAAGALRAERDALAAMPKDSGRNNRLNLAAFSLFQLVAGGELDAGEVERCLVEAAIANKLVADDGMRSVIATIASGRRAGLLHPRNRHGRARS
jgi:hypothetical protein